MLERIVIESLTTELDIICIEQVLICTSLDHEAIVGIAACGTKVEEEQQSSSLERAMRHTRSSAQKRDTLTKRK